jgi:hypothetical protein
MAFKITSNVHNAHNDADIELNNQNSAPHTDNIYVRCIRKKYACIILFLTLCTLFINLTSTIMSNADFQTILKYIANRNNSNLVHNLL